MMNGFEIITHLGSGSYGQVYKVKKIVNNNIYVIKTIPIVNVSYNEQTIALNEVKILAQMDCPYIVRYYDSFIDNKNLHIVMEYCNKGDLQSLLKKSNKSKDSKQIITGLKESITWNIILQIILGLHYLHKQRVLHRDLKTANVFLSTQDNDKNFIVKIGDLGVAKLLDSSTAFAQTIVGTPYYLSPELCSDRPYNDKSDCWALGVLIYECCTLHHPFEASNQYALIMKILQSPVTPPSSQSTSPELSKLIMWLLQKDPSNRPSIKEILTERVVRKKLEERNILIPMDIEDEPLTDYLGSHSKLKNTSSRKLSNRVESTDVPQITRATSGIRGDRIRGPAFSSRYISEKARIRHQIRPTNNSTAEPKSANIFNESNQYKSDYQEDKKSNEYINGIDNNTVDDITEYEYPDDFEEFVDDNNNEITLQLAKQVDSYNDKKQIDLVLEEMNIYNDVDSDTNNNNNNNDKEVNTNEDTLSVVDVNHEILAIHSLMRDTKKKSLDRLGEDLFNKLYDICLQYKSNDDQSNPNSTLVKDLEHVLCDQLQCSIENACEAIFSMKLLLAYEQRLDYLTNCK